MYNGPCASVDKNEKGWCHQVTSDTNESQVTLWRVYKMRGM